MTDPPLPVIRDRILRSLVEKVAMAAALLVAAGWLFNSR